MTFDGGAALQDSYRGSGVARAFGEEYVAYRRETKRLVPGLY